MKAPDAVPESAEALRARVHYLTERLDDFDHRPEERHACAADLRATEAELARLVASPAVGRTIFGCRCCDASTGGTNDGRFDAPGWGRIERIDGPNAICPRCKADPTALDALKADGYPSAQVAEPLGVPLNGSQVDTRHEQALAALSTAFGFTEPQPLDALVVHARSMTAYGEVPALRAEVARLTRALAEVHGIREGHGSPCYYCGRPCDCGAGDPGQWPVPLCHADEPYRVKWHHIGCVSTRLKRGDAAAAEVVTLRVEVAKLREAQRYKSPALRAVEAAAHSDSDELPVGWGRGQ